LSSAGISLGRAHTLASFVANEVRRTGAPIDELTPLGGLRRYAPSVDRVTLLTSAPMARHAAVLDALAQLSGQATVLNRTAERIAVATERGPIEVFLATPEQTGAALVWHTGPDLHVQQLQARAPRRGLLFEDGRLTDRGRDVPCPSENDFYRHLGLPYVAPELRESLDVLEAADQGRLPQLLSPLHVRGDLHSHTNWSDGRDTVEQMVAMARQLGYEYFAISDHSERSAASRTLARGDVGRQAAEIEAARRSVPGIELLHGIEVDIMPDGRLDFDDKVLEPLDLVLASLHDPAGHDGARLTRRCLSAIRHPLVNVITHPANRLVGRSPGYDLDFEAIYAAAAESGTALEIDGAPSHLDMDGERARGAVRAGVTVTIDSDCHKATLLDRQMRLGVGTARRGWVEARHVLNTRPLSEVRAFVAAKRQRRQAGGQTRV
jgi:DNA polymerase (family 10)